MMMTRCGSGGSSRRISWARQGISRWKTGTRRRLNNKPLSAIRMPVPSDLNDDDEMRQRRLKQANFVGPAGYISMEDGYAAEIEQQAIVRDQDACSFLELGGTDVADAENLVSEAAMRGFWQYYREIMGF